MKTKISVFIVATAFLLLSATTTVAQGTKAYYKKNGVTAFQSAVSDIDSIVFYNPVDQDLENLQIISDVHKLAHEKLSGLDEENPTPELAQWLTTLSEVSSVNYENNCIHIVYKNGLESYILILNNDGNEPAPRQAKIFSHPENVNLRSSTSNDESNILNNKNVIIWAPFYSSWYPYIETDALTGILTNSALKFPNPTYMKDSQCTVTSLENLTNYGIVVLATHGMVGGNVFATNQQYDPNNITISERLNLMNGKYRRIFIERNNSYIEYYGLTSKYIRSLSGNFEKSIIVNNSCHSAGTDSLSDAFFSKGAATYLGYSNSVCSDVCVTKTMEFFNGLTGPELKKTGEAYIPDYYFVQNCEPPRPPWKCSYILKGSTEMHFQEESSDWVLINGVKWATRNVGTPGTFVQNPEDYGEYYQWNNGTTDFLLDIDDDYRNSVYNKSNSWLPADPSPAGYRIPTLAELQSLLDTTYVKCEYWTLNGCRFTDRASGKYIFLPATGYRDGVFGNYIPGNNWCEYRSSTVSSSNSNPYIVRFIKCDGKESTSLRSDGYPIRPVAE